MIDLDTLERLANEATKGPWKHTYGPPCRIQSEYPMRPIGNGEIQSVSTQSASDSVHSEPDKNFSCTVITGCASRADANFVATSRTAVPELIAEVRRFKEGLIELLNQMDTADVVVQRSDPFSRLIVKQLLAGKRWDGSDPKEVK